MTARERVRPGDLAGSLLPFALMALFALISLLIVIAGARVYRQVQETTERNYDTRTVTAYIAGKVRAADANGMVAVEVMDGVPVLMLGSEISGKRYYTYIFCKDGALSEYFGSSERAFDPAFGVGIAAAESFVPALEGNLLCICWTDAAGTERTARLHLAAGEAGV